MYFCSLYGEGLQCYCAVYAVCAELTYLCTGGLMAVNTDIPAPKGGREGEASSSDQGSEVKSQRARGHLMFLLGD